MVGVAQLVEHRVVAPVVEGSSPFTHPIFNEGDCYTDIIAVFYFLFDL
jgi:hypothetical protein